MTDKIFFLSDINDKIMIKRIINSESMIICFDLKTHYYLKEQNIEHKLSEDYLTEREKEDVFQLAVNLWNWFEKEDIFNQFTFEKINFFNVLDTSEFHQIIIEKIKKFAMIKRIIEKEKPRKVFANDQLEKLIEPFLSDYKIKLELIDQKKDIISIYEKFTIPLKIIGITKNFVISRQKYFWIKKIIEKIIGKSFHLIFEDFEKECILFVDVNPKQYERLLKNINNENKNAVFFNIRRSAFSDLSSVNVLRKNNGKILISDMFVDSNEQKIINKAIIEKQNKIKEIWKNNDLFEKIFIFEKYQFWDSIKNDLLRIYLHRMQEYLEKIIFAKKIIEKINISSVVLLNLIGESEKLIQTFFPNKNKIILLEHAFTNYMNKNALYDILRINFKGINAVWGDTQKKYLLEQQSIKNDNILVTGSPRHDNFYEHVQQFQNKKNYVLVLPHTLTNFNAISGIHTFERQIEVMQIIFESLEKYSNVIPIIKLHPVQDSHNKFFKNKIQEKFPNIEIFQNESIFDIMNKVNSVISVFGEVTPSTTLLEALILQKPTLFIDITEKNIPFEFIEHNAVIAINNESEINQSINDLVNNRRIREDLIKNGNEFTKKYLSFTGQSSKRFSDILCDIK